MSTGFSAAPLTIRAATVEDADGLAAVHVASWQWAYAGLLPDELLAGLSVAERARRWRDILGGEPETVTFLAERADAVLGFVSVGPGRADVGGPSVGEVLALYVDPTVAGTGVGRLLHDTGLRWLAEHGFDRARLWVLRGNERADRFYRRHGWCPEEVEKREQHPDGFVLAEVRYERAIDNRGQT